LYEARRMQALEKELRLQEQARQDRDEFQRIIENQKIQRDLEEKMKQERQALIRQHAEELKKQILINEEKARQAKRTYLEEGKKIKDNLANEKRTLEHLKANKLVELISYGVPEKYTAELARKKIEV